MNYLLIALSTFAVLTATAYWVPALRYGVRVLVAMVLGVIAVGFVVGWGDAYLGLGVAGIDRLLMHLDEVMMARRGESQAAISIASRRNPPQY